MVSVGSTPDGALRRDLTGVTEVRAGVYVFFDLVMVGLDVCGLDEIALSVLVTVIGHQEEKGWLVTDAGWMALRATAAPRSSRRIRATGRSATSTADRSQA